MFLSQVIKDTHKLESTKETVCILYQNYHDKCSLHVVTKNICVQKSPTTPTNNVEEKPGKKTETKPVVPSNDTEKTLDKKTKSSEPQKTVIKPDDTPPETKSTTTQKTIETIKKVETKPTDNKTPSLKVPDTKAPTDTKSDIKETPKLSAKKIPEKTVFDKNEPETKLNQKQEEPPQVIYIT